MTGNLKDNKTFETKVSNLIAATRHLDVPQVLLLRRLTLNDPESLKWANARQLNVVFNVILSKTIERTGLDRFRAARDKNFDPLLPPDPSAHNEDRKILADLAVEMLGNTVTAMSEHEVALSKLLSMGPAQARARTIRHVPPIKEPPPLFAAQLGPEGARNSSLNKFRPPGEMAEDEDPAKPFVDFNTLFDDTICGYSRKILGMLQVKSPQRQARMPFVLAPEFGACYEEILRKFVLPQMRSSRHIQQLGMSYNWGEVGGGKLVDIIQGGEVNNPVLHNWDTRWNSFRASKVAKGKKLKPEDNPWPLIREDATRSGYFPPEEDHLQILQEVIRYEAESLGKAWRELSQLYEQEFSPNARQEQAREGAFRDGIMKWASKLPDHVGEFFAMKSYFIFPHIDGEFMRRLLNNFGRSDSDRRRAAPMLYEFVQGLTE